MVKLLRLISQLIFQKNSVNATQIRNDFKGLPEVNLWHISQFINQKIVPVVGYTPFPLSELSLMVGVTCYFKPTHIFEWGTNIGKSARIFYETIREFQISAQVISIDLPADIDHIEHPHSRRGVLVKGRTSVTLLTGDGLDTSVNYISKLRGNNKLLFFLDGDHQYKSVKRELIAILKKFPQAAILIHDTFYQLPGSKYNIGPRRAVDKIYPKYERKYSRIDTFLGLPGMTALLPKNKDIHETNH